MFFLIKNFLNQAKIIILFSIILFCLLIMNYYYNKALLKDAITLQQLSVLKTVSNRMSNWLNNEISSLEAINLLIKDINPKSEFRHIKNTLEKSQMITRFASIYVGYENNITISARKWEMPKYYNVNERPWYVNTLKNNKTFITKPYIDMGLKIPVVSLCTPVLNIYKKGVLCGILSLRDIKKDVLDLDFPNKEITFLIDTDNILLLHSKKDTSLEKNDMEFTIPAHSNPAHFETKANVYSFVKIPNSNWTIVVQSKKALLYKKLNQQFLIYFFIYLASFLLLLVVILIYNYKQKEQIEITDKQKRILKYFTKNSFEGVLIQNNKNKIIFFNKKFISLFSLDKKNLLLENSFDILKFLPTAVYNKIFDYIKKNETKQEPSADLKFTIDLNNKIKYFSIKIIPIHNDSGIYEGTIFICSDVTEIEKLKKSDKEKKNILFQQTKMAELGTMIGAISHQWRQPLNSLSIFLGNLLQLKAMNKLSDEIFNQNISRSLDNISYMVKTMDTFRNFYEPKSTVEEFDILKAIKDTIFITFANPEIYSIKIQIKYDMNQNHTCNNYINEFQQIIACLIINSKESLIKDKDNKNKKIKILVKKSKNKEFTIHVCDNGPGIDKNMLNNLFKPFSSTKNKKGGGNGLYISKLIAKTKLDGDIILKKRFKPTVFELKFKSKE